MVFSTFGHQHHWKEYFKIINNKIQKNLLWSENFMKIIALQSSKILKTFV